MQSKVLVSVHPSSTDFPLLGNFVLLAQTSVSLCLRFSSHSGILEQSTVCVLQRMPTVSSVGKALRRRITSQNVLKHEILVVFVVTLMTKQSAWNRRAHPDERHSWRCWKNSPLSGFDSNYLFIHLPNVLILDREDDESSRIVAKQRLFGGIEWIRRRSVCDGSDLFGLFLLGLRHDILHSLQLWLLHGQHVGFVLRQHFAWTL